MGIDVGMGFMGVQGWIGYDSSNTWWSQTLAAYPVGKVSNKSRLLLGTECQSVQYIDVISKFPAAGTAGMKGSQGLGLGGVRTYQFQVKEREDGPWGRGDPTDLGSMYPSELQGPAALKQGIQQFKSQRLRGRQRATARAGWELVIKN